jgi:hypothetical protein
MKHQLHGERIIPLKNVAGLSVIIGRPRPSYLRVWRWKKYGIDGIRLESFREGRQVFTSIEAVERFLERTNGGGQ